MTVHRYLRLAAGAFVLLSLALARLVDERFLWFTAFVGLNLFQSAFSDWCPLMTILRKLGVRDCGHGAESGSVPAGRAAGT